MKMKIESVSDILLFEEAAAYLRITLQDLLQLIQSNHLRYVLICDKQRIRRSDLMDFISHLTAI